MPFYQEFAGRDGLDIRNIERQMLAVDATIGVSTFDGSPITFRLKKTTAWSAAQITAARAVLDNAATQSPQLAAQVRIDDFPIEMRALVLTLVDQINVLRTAASLPTITPAQAIAAVRAKAGTL